MQLAEFERLLCESKEARYLYTEFIKMSTYLPRALAGAVASTSNDPHAVIVEGLPLDVLSVSSHNAVRPLPPNASASPLGAFPCPAPTFLSIAFPATIGYSSGWSVAYLTATVITGLWLLSMWLMPVSRQVAMHSVPPAAERQVAPEPLPASVGRITGMVDCKWNGRFSCFLGTEVRLGLRSDGNHLRHRGQGHLAGAGDV